MFLTTCQDFKAEASGNKIQISKVILGPNSSKAAELSLTPGPKH